MTNKLQICEVIKLIYKLSISFQICSQYVKVTDALMSLVLVFQNLNKYCASLSKGFQAVQTNQLTFEQVRDNMRSILHRMDPVMFPTGLEYISVSDLA